MSVIYGEVLGYDLCIGIVINHFIPMLTIVWPRMVRGMNCTMVLQE